MIILSDPTWEVEVLVQHVDHRFPFVIKLDADIIGVYALAIETASTNQSVFRNNEDVIVTLTNQANILLLPLL